MAFEDMRDKAADPMTVDEIDYVRDILDSRAAVGSPDDVELVTRIAALTPSQCKRLRYLFDLNGNAGDDTTTMKGGSKGMDFDPDRNRARVRMKVQLLLGYTPDDPAAARSSDVGVMTLDVADTVDIGWCVED